MKKSLIVALIVLAAAGCRREQAAPAAGPPMPPYKAQWLDGKPFDLASEKGSVVLLNVWATWCGPCRYEIPELEKLHAKYAARGFKVVGVSIDEGGAADVQPFLQSQPIRYPVAIDPEGNIAGILQASVIPTSVMVDKTGNVVWKKVGVIETTDETLTKALESALAR